MRKAIASGRIDVEPDGSIDPVKADAQWSAATDRNKQRSDDSVARGVERARETIAADERKPVTRAHVEAVNEGAAAADRMEPAEPGGMTMAKAAAADKAYSAQIKALKLKQLKGQLVDIKAVRNHVYDLARKERDSWLQMPARKAANMAAELGVDAHLMEQTLDRYIRDHLAELAEIKVDLSAS
ncbi:elements of external origin [Leisingera daeponensis]|uniref:elements of external origin n=1 Tax=Leisingera daeponensis TaxID=405746 RepID=UPI001C97F93B|nr:elements of external origin [Leisingera daeponensis]MBY6055392.1 elements of external origin [Leisingera daeponensis]